MRPIPFTALSLLAALAVACGGGGGSEESSEAPSASPTAAHSAVRVASMTFSSPGVSNILTIANLRADESGLKADVTIDNTSPTTTLRLDLNTSHAHLLTGPQAEAWKAGYPRAFQEVDLKKFPGTMQTTRIPISVTSATPLPVEVPPNSKWSGSLSSTTRIGSDVVAVFFVLSNIGRQSPSGDVIDSEAYFSDATRPFVSLSVEVTVTPLPPIEPLVVNPGDKLVISKIGLERPLSLLGVGRDGVMPNAGSQQVAIYDFGNFGLGVGGSPKTGNAVIAAYYYPQSSGAQEPFARILTLVPGDTVDLVYQGQSYRYTVAWKCTVPNSNFTEIIRKDNANTLTLMPGVGGSTQYIIRAEQTPGSISKDCPSNTAPFTGTEVPPR